MENFSKRLTNMHYVMNAYRGVDVQINYLEVSGQLHVPAALLREKSP
jgi:hypothetical protein